MGRTLVTGGAGYIGLLVADELLRAGREVTVLDVLLHGQSAPSDVRFVEGDIRDGAARARALEDADAVVHLAAIVGIRRARAIPSSRRRSTWTRRWRSPPRRLTSSAS